MYILVDKNNVVMHILKTLEKDKNGYYLLDNNRCIPNEFKMQDMEGNVTVDKVDVYEVDEVPEGVEPTKYCYTKEDGFFKNPDYKQYFSEEDRISALEDAMDTLLGF